MQHTATLLNGADLHSAADETKELIIFRQSYPYIRQRTFVTDQTFQPRTIRPITEIPQS